MVQSLALHGWSLDQKHRYHLGACQKGCLLDPTSVLLNEHLDFTEVPRDSCAERSLRNLVLVHRV